MVGLKGLELVKVREDIHRILYPPTYKSQSRKGREDVEVSGLDKVEGSIGVKDGHYSEAWGGRCGNCGHKWLQGVAKVARWSKFEGLKMLQG